ncbi:MAG: hypothetical protein ABWY93_04800 [Mycobacterium sp.]
MYEAKRRPGGIWIPSIRQRWRTGWVILPGTPRWPGQKVHRPHPDMPAVVLCERVIGERQRLDRRPEGIAVCPRCEAKVANMRQREKDQVRRLEVAAAARKTRVRISDPEAVDRHDRSRNASSSVRAARGGLPGLGRRH